jgi:hypothetical protein
MNGALIGCLLGNRSTVCCFDCGDECTALRTKQCEGCKFFKTQYEFDTAHEQAAQLLYSKGLEAYRTSYGIMTTRKIKEISDDEQ